MLVKIQLKKQQQTNSHDCHNRNPTNCFKLGCVGQLFNIVQATFS